MPTALNSISCSVSSCGHSLDLSEDAFGFVRSSTDCVDQPEELRRRLEEDGYLYISGFFDRDLIHAARASVCDRLAKEGKLDPAYPAIEGIAHPDKTSNFNREPARNNSEVKRVVYGPELVGFYEQLFGEPVRHFDYTWFRAMSRGQGSPPHCDLVYMGRGTRLLYTCWIPYGDTSLDTGGLMLLEESHHKSGRIERYLEVDVDAYCTNRPRDLAKLEADGGMGHTRSGNLSKTPSPSAKKSADAGSPPPNGKWVISSPSA